MFLGEIRLLAAHESLKQIAYFINGVAHQLRLTEAARSDLEIAAEETAATLLERLAPPSMIVINALLQEDMIFVRLTHDGARRTTQEPHPSDSLAEGMRLRLIQELTDNFEHGVSPAGNTQFQIMKRITQTPAATPRERLAPQRELQALQIISQAMATNITLDDLLKLIIDQLVDAIDAERGTLYLIDAEHGELYSKILLEDSNIISEIRIKIGEGIAGFVAKTGESVNIKDAYSDSRFMRSIDKQTGFTTRTMLTMPLRNPSGTIIGVVQCLNKRGGPFSSRDERLLLAMSAQVAISIENARLHRQELQQELLNQELTAAKRIQESLLPAVIPQHPNWEIAAFWRPARRVAGDFYDFQPLEDGRWSVAIGDVSGKGIPAALFMGVSAAMLRFVTALDLPPVEVMRNLNRALAAMNRDSQMFLSILVGFLDFSNGTFACASAGHNPPLIRRASGETAYVKVPGVIAGMFEDAPFQPCQIDIHAGDVLVLYTDGITEATDPHDDLFGEDRLKALLERAEGKSATVIIDRIVAAITTFSGARGSYDDETILVIRRLH
ncbi:MAG TPA: SpoIIE family protein phosphatase [Aggregatilineales bacterium]|nr:SpoIIE family protein phosphatase [Anaerolineales bacterium]HRE46131.1 SpoIIE family protein phosphatase [Aggregatilineales bacterium]